VMAHHHVEHSFGRHSLLLPGDTTGLILAWSRGDAAGALRRRSDSETNATAAK
jgi:hypothetical protein